jgi:hypothetical protein
MIAPFTIGRRPWPPPPPPPTSMLDRVFPLEQCDEACGERWVAVGRTNVASWERVAS